MTANILRIFGLGDSRAFAESVARFLDLPLAEHHEQYFGDKECYVRSKVNVRGTDVYVVMSLHTDSDESVGEKLTKLLFFIGSLRDASARRITVVAPYLGYARQDRKTDSRAPISIKYLAQCVEAVGADRILTLDVHNLSGFQNAFRIPSDNLEARNLLADFLCGTPVGLGNCLLVPGSQPLSEQLRNADGNLTVLAPDSGGLGRAKRFRNALEQRLGSQNQIDVVCLDKERHGSDTVRLGKIVGDVRGKRVVILDDMIASGGTVAMAQQAVQREGGEVWAVCASHGLFVGDADQNLKDVPRLIITDTVRPWRLKSEKWQGRLHVISTALMFAKAIRRTHEEGGSISDLLQ